MKVKTDYDDNDDSDFEMSDEEVEDEVLAQRNNILNIDQLIVIIIYKRKLFMIMPKKLVYHI